MLDASLHADKIRRSHSGGFCIILYINLLISSHYSTTLDSDL